ncbi:hypothetical protein ACIRJM_23265 [Streptomyces sp. NPDC102405]|uniref:hypothetical protein n=1 Tax=Streptomyces sp. NPDC102405 TaxID=3366170 RepID=UPI00382D4091
MNAEEFNALYEVGVPVFAYPGARPEDIPSARRLVTRTRTKAQQSNSGDPVVWVDGEGSYICLTHVDVVPEDEWQAARLADEAAAKEQAAKEAADRRRRIYIDGKGDGWIDLTVDPDTGERELAGITNPWKIASADEVRADAGGLTEIGRCW